MSNQVQVVPVVKVVNNQTITTSTEIAHVFGKQHKNVLQAINNLEIPNDIHQLNFKPVNIVEENAIGGKVDKSYYNLTRDGFTILAMGFTGAKAMKFKLAYIEAFNRMEAELHGKALPAPANIPVPSGHKRCSKCREVKPLSGFGRNVTSKDGYAYYCKCCFADVHQECRNRNRERNLTAMQPQKKTDSPEEHERLLREAGVKLYRALIATGNEVLGMGDEIMDVKATLRTIAIRANTDIERQILLQHGRLSDFMGKFHRNTTNLLNLAAEFCDVLYGLQETPTKLIEDRKKLVTGKD